MHRKNSNLRHKNKNNNNKAKQQKQTNEQTKQKPAQMVSIFEAFNAKIVSLTEHVSQCLNVSRCSYHPNLHYIHGEEMFQAEGGQHKARRTCCEPPSHENGPKLRL